MSPRCAHACSRALRAPALPRRCGCGKWPGQRSLRTVPGQVRGAGCSGSIVLLEPDDRARALAHYVRSHGGPRRRDCKVGRGYHEAFRVLRAVSTQHHIHVRAWVGCRAKVVLESLWQVKSGTTHEARVMHRVTAHAESMCSTRRTTCAGYIPESNLRQKRSFACIVRSHLRHSRSNSRKCCPMGNCLNMYVKVLRLPHDVRLDLDRRFPHSSIHGDFAAGERNSTRPRTRALSQAMMDRHTFFFSHIRLSRFHSLYLPLPLTHTAMFDRHGFSFLTLRTAKRSGGNQTHKAKPDIKRPQDGNLHVTRTRGERRPVAPSSTCSPLPPPHHE